MSTILQEQVFTPYRLLLYMLNEHCYFTVRELLPELLTQLVGLLVDDESGDSQEVSFSLNMLLIQ